MFKLLHQQVIRLALEVSLPPWYAVMAHNPVLSVLTAHRKNILVAETHG